MDDPDLLSTDTPVKDQGVGRQWSHEYDQAGHEKRHESVVIGLRLPKRPHRPGKHHHHHHHHHHHKSTTNHKDGPTPTTMTPSEQIQHLIGENDEETHSIFCQMDTLHKIGTEFQWREAARWVKYEEDVEEGGERWSKPHVASLSLHSLFELRSSILQGSVMLDMDAYHIGQIVDLLLDNLVNNKLLEESLRDPIRAAIVCQHAHQHQKRRRSMMPSEVNNVSGFRKQSMKRTFSEIGRSLSVKGGMRNNTSVPNMENINGDIHESPSSSKLNQQFMRKIPDGAEAANIFVGELDCLKYQVSAFIRLTEGRVVGDLTEVPIPTRFIYILLGPAGSLSKNHEMGRSISTIMVDEVYREVAYKAKSRQDLLYGIDEFLDQVTVLPPGEWDPKIRIEPPDSVPSQEARKAVKPLPVPSQASGLGDEEQGSPAVVFEEEESHFDPTLVRTGRLFGGMIEDIKRKIPYYGSDFKDCLHIQCIASTIYLFLATLTPNVTFGGLLGLATDQYMGTMECILTASIVGILFALFAGQPLNILGSTGPMLVLEMILYNVCKDQGLVYMPFRCWVGIWTTVMIVLIVAFDLSALVRYITRFTEESFASLIAIIFIYEAFKKVFGIAAKYPINPDPDVHISYECYCSEPTFDTNNTFFSNMTTPLTGYTIVESSTVGNTTSMPLNYSTMNKEDCLKYNGTLLGDGCDSPQYYPDVFFLSLILFAGTFVIANALTKMKSGRFFPSFVRQLFSDFAVLTAIIVMVVVDILIGVKTPKLIVPSKFEPTRPGRSWFISPIDPDNPWWIAIVAAAPAILATILVFMDQQITAVIVNRKENKLKKGSGYHLDMMVVAVCILICSFLGLPWYVAATVSALAHVMSLKKESECTAPGEKPVFLGCREQRVTALMVGILSGLAVFLTKILGIIPMPVLYGVFLYMGVAALRGMQFVDRIMIIFMPAKYQPDRTYLRHVPIKRVHLFTFIQVLCLAALMVIKQIKSISIIFPMMVAGTCFVRKSMDWIFEQRELKWLDDIMPEEKSRAKEDKKKKRDGDEDEEEKETLLSKPKPNFNEKVNISEEMSKTSIWLQVRRDSCRQDINGTDLYNLKKKRKESKNGDNQEKAAFYFGDEAEDDKHKSEKNSKY